MENQQTKTIDFWILTFLSKGITSTKELLKKIEELKNSFDKKYFYPALSRLTLSNILCFTWSKSPDGLEEKHFYLTSNGEKYLKNLKEAA